MPRIVTFYNNKGGVSKTTTGFNWGAYIAKKKQKKVLFVDCDPQSNLTELFFASCDIGTEQSLPGSSLYSTLEPRFRGDKGRVDVEAISLTESKIYKNLFLLRGDFNLGQTGDVPNFFNLIYCSTILTFGTLRDGLYELNTFYSSPFHAPQRFSTNGAVVSTATCV